MGDNITQPEINIGLVGHVDHGKTTLVSRLSGKWTDTHSEELKRGITIRLGYADAVFYKCEKCKKYGVSEKCSCGGKAGVLRKVSFIDAPGHETLMATMLSGAAIMDAALLLIAANEECPQPQTREHLMALEIIGVKNIIIIQNKIDLVDKENAIKNYEQIKNFIKGTIAEKATIIPISAQQNINIDLLVEEIEKNFKTPKRDLDKDPLMYIARSFDINRPGSEWEDLAGGVLGGALKQGKLSINQEIEIRPGLKEEGKQSKWKSVRTKIIDLKVGGESVKEITPGGSCGVMTELDPSIVKADNLAGSVLGLPDKMPDVFNELNLKIKLLDRVVGAKDDLVVEPIKKGESLMINVNSSVSVGIVDNLKKDIVHLILRRPLCIAEKDRVTLSRMIGARWRLIGIAELENGTRRS